MTCFWDGILSSLDNHDLKLIDISEKPPILQFINTLKNKNTKTNHILWNNNQITSKQLIENFTHVKDFSTSNINNGYLCSTFEPFLFLIAQLFSIDIIHNYNGNIIKYTNIEKSRKTVKYKSNTGHFWKD